MNKGEDVSAPSQWAKEFVSQFAEWSSSSARSDVTLDGSADSLKYVDEYLENLYRGFVSSSGIIGRFFRKPPLSPSEIEHTIRRAGSYVGEVVRKEFLPDHRWFSHREWLALNPGHEELIGADEELPTLFILGNDKGDMCLPLGKVYKYLANGSEDSVYYFAQMMRPDLEGEEVA